MERIFSGKGGSDKRNPGCTVIRRILYEEKGETVYRVYRVAAGTLTGRGLCDRWEADRKNLPCTVRGTPGASGALAFKEYIGAGVTE